MCIILRCRMEHLQTNTCQYDIVEVRQRCPVQGVPRVLVLACGFLTQLAHLVFGDTCTLECEALELTSPLTLVRSVSLHLAAIVELRCHDQFSHTLDRFLEGLFNCCHCSYSMSRTTIDQ
jgi:hypothetical protein